MSRLQPRIPTTLALGVHQPAQLINCHCYLEPITAKEFDVIAGEMAAQAEADYIAEVMRERGLPPIQFSFPTPAA